MRVEGRLPADRSRWGDLSVLGDDGTVLFGPRPYRGKADSQAATAHGNPTRDPLQPFGDHPSGTYLVTEVVAIDPGDAGQYRKFGPYKLRLDPVAGDALQAARNGRTDLLLHGGAPGTPGTANELRASNGCGRTADETIAGIAALVAPELASGRAVLYTCESTI